MFVRVQDLLKFLCRVHGRSNRWVFTLRDQVLGLFFGNKLDILFYFLRTFYFILEYDICSKVY